MNENENQLLDTLFELDLENVPKHDIEVPSRLKDKLYQISEHHGHFGPKWKVPLAAAASIFAVAALVFFQQQQTTNQTHDIELAKEDLRLALQYFEQANNKARPYIESSLSNNFRKASIQPIYNSARAAQL